MEETRTRVPRGGSMRRLAARVLAVLLLAPGWVAGAWAEDGADFMAIARSAPSGDEYPESGALILLLDGHERVRDDGRAFLTLQRAVKILTNQGRREFSDFKLPFDSEVQTVRVRTARTIRRDFRTSDVDEDAINDITPPELKGASVYSNVLEKVFSYPAALTGSVLTLDLERETEAREGKRAGGWALFQADEPILAREFALTVPGIPVTYRFENGSLEPEIETSDGETTYRWTAEEVPGVVPEPNMPPRRSVFPRLLYTTARGWDQVAEEFAEGFFPNVICEGDLARAVEAWTEGTSTEEDRIREIFLHVTRDVRSVELDLGKGGYEPNPAPEVYHNRYGDCRDKAVLLVAALRKAGVEAHPVLFDHDPVPLVEEVPTVKQFNDVGVIIRTRTGLRFLDPGAEHCPYGFYPEGGGNRGLVVTPEGFEIITIPEVPHEGNFSEKTLLAKVASDGSAEGRVECSLGGYFDFQARRSVAEKTAKEREMEFSSAANRLVEGAALGETSVTDLADLTSPVEIKLGFSAEGFGYRQGDILIVRVPPFPLRFANAQAYPGLEDRSYDFMAESSLLETYRVELEIPEAYDALYVPPAYAKETETGRWAIESTVDGEEGRIVLTRTVALKSRRVSREAYPEFKAAFDAVTSPKNSLILLERRKQQGM